MASLADRVSETQHGANVCERGRETPGPSGCVTVTAGSTTCVMGCVIAAQSELPRTAPPRIAQHECRDADDASDANDANPGTCRIRRNRVVSRRGDGADAVLGIGTSRRLDQRKNPDPDRVGQTWPGRYDLGEIGIGADRRGVVGEGTRRGGHQTGHPGMWRLP